MTLPVPAAGSFRRLRATLEYDGTDFVGWQSQGEGQGRTVQTEVEAALARITGARSPVVGSGRTDAGVHATGQVAHFDTAWAGSLATLQRALNAVLPPDIAVLDLAEAPPDFHARFSAREREYVYTILDQPLRSPLARRTAWHVLQPLDVTAMREASSALLGRHDFRAFGRPMKPTGSTVRTVTHLAVDIKGGHDLPAVDGLGRKLVITVRADAFLRHMVRRVAFVLVEVGRGRLTATDLQTLLADADPNRLHGIAPPQGLCLTRVSYGVEGDRLKVAGSRG